MSIARPRRIWLSILAIAVTLCAVVAFNQERVGLGIASLLAERRPALLSDAKWNDPASARLFLARFADGVQESELIEWLESNKFTIDGDYGVATRRVYGFPCNEGIKVSWSRRPDGTIADAEALISEKGCL